MMISKYRNYLLIVEGKVTEKEIFKSILEKYGFNVVVKEQLDIKVNRTKFLVDKTQLSLDKNNIIVIQGPRNRIHDWLLLQHNQFEDFERMFQDINTSFAGIFIIYDVDHTSNEELEEMFSKYNDETDDGLLLLSSPCIEILADMGRAENNLELKLDHLKTYKKNLNKQFDLSHKCSTQKYIIDNFELLALYYLERNTKQFKERNVMRHPELIIESINKHNERSLEEVTYRYFTTVVYVCIAYILGLTKEIDNVEDVKAFFLKHM